MKHIVAAALGLGLQVGALSAYGAGNTPYTDMALEFGAHSQAKVELGKALFFDKILSGNRNISCATCHHPFAGGGDGLALPIGEGGVGLGVTRNTGNVIEGIHERVPRNAPPLFNLGAAQIHTMFHDGRVAVEYSEASGFESPAGEQLPLGLDSTLAVQAMFPVTSAAEMAGQPGENAVANAAAAGVLAGDNGVWGLLAQRLRNEAVYVEMFKAAYPDQITQASDIAFKDAANAIAAFESVAWRSDNSRYDRFVRGENDALSQQERKGLKIFHGKAGCGTCHSGPLFSDQNFHAIAMPQIGPGKGHNSEGYSDGREDFGREAVTQDPADRFKFRTPSLRNIALTAPYGHAGAYDSLRAVVKHHLSPVESLYNYDPSQLRLPSRTDLDDQDLVVMNDPWRVAQIAERNALAPVDLTEDEFEALIAFLHTLTEDRFLDQRDLVPRTLPSGLTLAD